MLICVCESALAICGSFAHRVPACYTTSSSPGPRAITTWWTECSCSINGKKLSSAAIPTIIATWTWSVGTTAFEPVSNILFVLYHDFSANSAVHVHNFANQLAAQEHSTAVAIPQDADRGQGLGEQEYSVHRFDQVDGEWSRVFPNGRGPDIVHAWTPRENVRLFCEKLASFCTFSLFVHLEDNEELILEVNLDTPFEKLARSPFAEIPGNLAHPRHYRTFIASADGVTMIMDRLEQFVPARIPKLVLWPGANEDVFFPRPRSAQQLEQLGITNGTVVLCYTGNVHSANARDVRSLY